MDGYIATILMDQAVRDVANDRLFKENQDPVYLPESERKAFHSDVAKLLFLAKRVKMSCLTTVSALASRVAAPTTEDRKKLDRVFNCVASTKS